MHIIRPTLTNAVSADLPSCGRVPLKITKQDNKVRYLSECKWTSSTSSESIKFYGRDQDVTLTCFVPDGSNILNNTNWYKVCSPSALSPFILSYLILT